MREILYTLDGGVYYGVLYLSEIINAYISDENELNEEWVKIISADYQSGIFSSRNAAFQKQLNELTGSSLSLDGDFGSQTQKVLNDFLVSKGKKELKVNKDIFQESKTKEFENQEVYKFIKEQYKIKFSSEPEYVVSLENVISSAKFGSEITSKRYVEGTLSRYKAYCNLLNC